MTLSRWISHFLKKMKNSMQKLMVWTIVIVPLNENGFGLMLLFCLDFSVLSYYRFLKKGKDACYSSQHQMHLQEHIDQNYRRRQKVIGIFILTNKLILHWGNFWNIFFKIVTLAAVTFFRLFLFLWLWLLTSTNFCRWKHIEVLSFLLWFHVNDKIICSWLREAFLVWNFRKTLRKLLQFCCILNIS